ncbi:MAG: GNAT family N-acetyltransferase [Flavisolibacter sp.]
MQHEWLLKNFDSLSPRELYSILQLRNEVFVVEQNCVFQDADNNDQQAFHLMCFQTGKLLAYTRLLPAGSVYELASIGRVVTSPSIRGSGVGRELMERSINAVYNLWGRQSIKIGAQLYLKKFYQSFGFEQVSDTYLEDGIEHIHMIKKI